MRLDPVLTPLQTVDIEVYPDRVVIDRVSNVTSIRSTTTTSRSNWRASNIILSVFFLAQAAFLAYLWVKTGEGVVLFVSALMALPGIVTLVLFLQSESGEQESD